VCERLWGIVEGGNEKGGKGRIYEFGVGLVTDEFVGIHALGDDTHGEVD
jgi:hypothetical protein